MILAFIAVSFHICIMFLQFSVNISVLKLIFHCEITVFMRFQKEVWNINDISAIK